MASMADVYRALNTMQEEGIVEKYAVGGGMAALFYAETSRTYDIDVFVLVPQSGLLVDLGPIYKWARDRDYTVEQEYLIIHGVPVQILVAGPGLQTEAIDEANTIDYEGVPVRIMKPEYLILLYLQAASSKRIDRARDLVAARADTKLIEELAMKFNMQAQWQRMAKDGT